MSKNKSPKSPTTPTLSKADKARMEAMFTTGLRRPFSNPVRPTTDDAAYGYGNAPSAQDAHSAAVPAGRRAKKPAKGSY